MRPLKLLVLTLLIIAIVAIIYLSTTDYQLHTTSSKVMHLPNTVQANESDIKKITNFFKLDFTPDLRSCFLVLYENNQLKAITEVLYDGGTVNDLNSQFNQLRFVCFEKNKRLSTLITPAYFNIQDVHYRIVKMEMLVDGVLADGSTVPLMLLPPESAAAINQEESKQALNDFKSTRIARLSSRMRAAT